MKKLILVITLVLGLLLVGCDADILENPLSDDLQSKVSEQFDEIVPDTTENTEEVVVEEETEVEEPVVEEVSEYSYQTILDEYTQKLRDATPLLIEEYNEAAKSNEDGLMGLAKLCNEKVSELAKISTDGIQEMASYYLKHGSGSYEEYSEWAGKLQDVYLEEAAKIQDVYMDSAT